MNHRRQLPALKLVFATLLIVVSPLVQVNLAQADEALTGLVKLSCEAILLSLIHI